MSPVVAAALITVAAVVAFAIGVTLYVTVSYMLMLAHTERRPWRSLLREALAELRFAVLTQPLLPLYYLFGRTFGRADGATRGCPVVFVHGYAQNRVGFIGIARALSARGFGPLHGFNYPWFLSIDANARRLARFLDQVRRATSSEHVDLVCHSMGGLVALEYLRQAGDAAGVRCCVTIASPHAGVVFKGPIPGRCGRQLRTESDYLREIAQVGLSVRVLSIFSTHDNVVHPPSTSSLAARGGTDLALDGGGHLALLFEPKVVDGIAAFLQHGQVTPSPARLELERLGVARTPAVDDAPAA